jgi:hypothetical protein
VIVFLLRPLARLAALLVLGVLGIAGLVVAVAAAVPGGLPWLADTVSAPALRDTVVSGLRRLEAPGPTAVDTLWVGVAMLGGGLLVAIGGLWPSRERLLDLGHGNHARRRAVADAAASVARRESPGKVRARVRGRRGRVVLWVPNVRREAVKKAAAPFAEQLGRRLSVRASRRRQRVV